MFGRIFLIISTVVSLLWLGYATYDRINQGKQYLPEYVFGDEDEEVIVLLNPNKKDALLQEFDFQLPEIKQFIQEINPENIERMYLSKKRGQFIIIAKKEIKEENLVSFFKGVSQFSWNGKTLKIGSLIGQFDKNKLYFSNGNYLKHAAHWEELYFDSNADAALIRFTVSEPAVVDIYVKAHGIVEYKSSVDEKIAGSKVNDKVVFAAVIPSSCSFYEFYETDYLRYIEPELKNSPMNNWLKYGLVKLKINELEVFVSDYIEGQEPIQVLYDFYRKEANNEESAYFEGSRLTKLMQNSNGFYIYQLDDYVVFSSNKLACEMVIADYKLGNTLAQQPKRAEEIYGRLPQKVNYRKVNASGKESISIYEHLLLTTKVGSTTGKETTSNNTPQIATNSFVVNGVASGIYFIDSHNFYVLTQNNLLSYFENDQKKWEKDLQESIVGEANLIDIYANDKTQLLITTNKKIHVIDINGNEPSGFPVDLGDETATQSTLLYRWKGNGYFLTAVNGGKIMQLDNQGRELAIIKTNLKEISNQPIVWVSANKPFIGVTSDDHFEMIQAENKKLFRSFAIKEKMVALKLANEIKLMGVANNQLIAYDQKGGQAHFEKFSNGQLVPTLVLENGIIVKDQQLLKLFNSQGIQWGKIVLPFNDLADIQLYTTNSGISIAVGVDGLENKVHVWRTNGEKYSKETFDGSKMVRYHDGYLYTCIDNLVVRYPLDKK